MVLSRRYAPHMTALLLVAAIPVMVHSYADVRRDECADPFRLAASTRRSDGAQQRDTFMKKRFGAFQWKEGQLRAKAGLPPVSWAVIRTYDAKTIYYRIATRLLGGQPDAEALEWVDAAGERLPIRRLRYDPDPGSRAAVVAAYLLVYDGRPVANPYLNQLLSAPRRIFSGSLPMTVFFASSRATLERTESVEQRQGEWLLDSWQRYRSICFPD